MAINPLTGEQFVDVTNGAAHVADVGFIPLNYNSNLTMNGTARVEALVAGCSSVQVCNLGATTEAIRVAFGTDATDAENNLTIGAGAAATGYYIPSIVDGGASACREIGVPSGATHIAICNAVASDTQTVTLTQGSA